MLCVEVGVDAVDVSPLLGQREVHRRSGWLPFTAAVQEFVSFQRK